ncbi:hypothetical protein [Microvirga roseola]|uniref:hypothetical protein n=1 Tax=Microvirga roseola TaxID=2883126 RepID=UPI001E4BB729|nr:hypothetical protein [Microvirga roseola]
MQSAAILVGLLIGPALLLVLARHLGGAWSVRMAWRRVLRWMYGFGLAGAIGLLAALWIEGIEGDEAITFFMASVIAVIFGLSGLLTWTASRLLTRKAPGFRTG